jgi:hypothetical protein
VTDVAFNAMPGAGHLYAQLTVILEMKRQQKNVVFFVQFFTEHPLIPLVDYCRRPDVSTFLHNLTEIGEPKHQVPTYQAKSF